MKIMHIIGSLGHGGAEMGIVRLIQAFRYDENMVNSVCSIGSNVAMKKFLPKETKCYSLGIDGPSYTAFLPLLKLLKKTKTDIVHVNNLAPWFDVALASRLAGCACIETFHGVEEKTIALPLCRRLIIKTAAFLSSSVTAVSESAKELLIALSGINKSKVWVLPNGVDTNIFRPCDSITGKRELRTILNLPEDAFLIGCVAALRPVKDHAGLFKAFVRMTIDKQTPNTNESTYLILIGDGALESDLKGLAQKLGISERVIFMGRRNDVDEILRALDAFVLNSETEGMSYAVLEAMASGLPIVATNVGANPKLIDQGKEGYLVSHGDLESLTNGLVKLISDETLLFKMGENSRRKIVEFYSLDKMITIYKALYKEVRSHKLTVSSGN